MEKLDLDKIKTIEDVKNVLKLLDMEFYFPEDSPKYKLFKKYTVIPEKPKSLEQIQKEFEDKIDAILSVVESRFKILKENADIHYDKKTKEIFNAFETAKKNGSFPQIITQGLLSNLNLYSNITNYSQKNAGFFEYQNVKFFLNKKPKIFFRWFLRNCFDIKWVDS